jgi:hypothetical protein
MNALTLLYAIVILTPPTTPISAVRANLGRQWANSGEFATICIAADRNDCYGDDFLILLAIRKAENGRPGREFGILHPRAIDTNLDIQAGWCAATIVKNRVRWVRAGKPVPFIEFLGRRYCPVGAENDPAGLNHHWIKNVNYFFKKYRR